MSLRESWLSSSDWTAFPGSYAQGTYVHQCATITLECAYMTTLPLWLKRKADVSGARSEIWLNTLILRILGVEHQEAILSDAAY